MQRKKKMRKKIYSEQLLSVQKEKESQYPAQEIYVTGYVIELKKDCYFAGWQDGKILCRSYSYARYFGSVKSAEAYVKKNLAFAGLRCYICKVSWGLVIPVMESSMEENIKRYVKEMELYGYLTCEKSDEKLCILKELLKKKCVPVKFSTEQLQKVAKSLSEKRLSRWMQEEFQNITDLKPVTAMWLLASLDDLHGFEKEITKDKQVYFLLRDKELLSQCDSVSGLKELLCKQDSSWKSLKEELMLTEEFQTENQERIQEFLFEGGAEIMAAYLKSRSCKQEEIRRLVVAELLGKFLELKYPAGDLEREIAYPITTETENEWKTDLCRSAGCFLAKEETGLLPVMQIGEIPIYSCLSYIDGTNNECLLSCFDSNKKLLFIEKNGETVFRAILRLTKGSYEGETEQKKIEFTDMLNANAKSEEKKEELVLFLERYYQKGLKEQEVYQAAQLAIALAEEKAQKLGARLVLSSYYNSVLPTGKEKYVSSIYYLYISASKNGKQYLDSLGGTADISSSESYKSNRFYIENKK